MRYLQSDITYSHSVGAAKLTETGQKNGKSFHASWEQLTGGNIKRQQSAWTLLKHPLGLEGVQLNGIFKNRGTRGLFERKGQLTLDMGFSFVASFLDRVLGIERKPDD